MLSTASISQLEIGISYRRGQMLRCCNAFSNLKATSIPTFCQHFLPCVGNIIVFGLLLQLPLYILMSLSLSAKWSIINLTNLDLKLFSTVYR